MLAAAAIALTLFGFVVVGPAPASGEQGDGAIVAASLVDDGANGGAEVVTVVGQIERTTDRWWLLPAGLLAFVAAAWYVAIVRSRDPLG